MYFDSEILCLCIIKNKKHRKNYDCINSLEEYYSVSVFILLIDSLILNLENCFKQDTLILSSKHI